MQLLLGICLTCDICDLPCVLLHGPLWSRSPNSSTRWGIPRSGLRPTTSWWQKPGLESNTTRYDTVWAHQICLSAFRLGFETFFVGTKTKSWTKTVCLICFPIPYRDENTPLSTWAPKEMGAMHESARKFLRGLKIKTHIPLGSLDPWLYELCKVILKYFGFAVLRFFGLLYKGFWFETSFECFHLWPFQRILIACWPWKKKGCSNYVMYLGSISFFAGLMLFFAVTYRWVIFGRKALGTLGGEQAWACYGQGALVDIVKCHEQCCSSEKIHIIFVENHGKPREYPYKSVEINFLWNFLFAYSSQVI